ncbi:MAG: hypothetical protein NWE95_12035 [Candidatus Bathyarchaeota archaeon]|nr:hypothetical protein [Candidatus Bathyarchaeota archaeon]
MMRTIEVLLVIIIIAGAYVSVSYLTKLPDPREVAPVNLRRLSLATLQMLDSDYDLGTAVFDNDPAVWGRLQVALSASLPPNVVYNLTVYNVNSDGELYSYVNSISNAESLGTNPDVSVYMVASSNVTYNVVAEKIGEGNGGTLYILNCSDANGWWITGYTAQNLAQDLYDLLSPYFNNTVLVQSTTQLGQILNGTAIGGESLEKAVVINTFGEAVPIPSGYYASSGVGYDPGSRSYARYAHTLGQRVLQYNWTWVSIVGYPLYYVSNTEMFSTSQNGRGIYGMREIGTDGATNTGPAGLTSFLRGLDNQTFSYNASSITGSPGVVYLSSQALVKSNYYGIYPSTYQTSTRALPASITSTYNLNVTTYVFNTVSTWNPAAVYRHIISSGGTSQYKGAFYAIGLTRTPDIRITALGILTEYKPRLFPLKYTASDASRMVVLQLGLIGGS